MASTKKDKIINHVITGFISWYTSKLEEIVDFHVSWDGKYLIIENNKEIKVIPFIFLFSRTGRFFDCTKVHIAECEHIENGYLVLSDPDISCNLERTFKIDYRIAVFNLQDAVPSFNKYTKVNMVYDLGTRYIDNRTSEDNMKSEVLWG